MSVLVSTEAHGGQKRASDPSELEFQAAVSCEVWMLGTELRVLCKSSKQSSKVSHLSSPVLTSLLKSQKLPKYLNFNI